MTNPTQTTTLDIDVFSDVMCPFCYMGDAALEHALRDFAHRDTVRIRYRSYQLMPDLSHEHPFNVTESLAAKYGTSLTEAEQMNASITERGRTYGLDYRFDRAQGINTRTAHRLIQHAGTVGHQHDLVRRLFHAYFTDGANIADYDTLVGIAVAAGLDGDAARAALTDDALDERVDADIAEAKTLGITGVPFFVLGGRYGVSGAQTPEHFLQALTTAWNHAHPA